MKEHVQKTGIRQWAGEDFIDLQSEPLKAIEGFYKEYGPCIIQGGHVTSNGNGTFSVSSGLAALSGKDVEGNDTFKVVAFAALEKTTLPVYLTLTCSIVERAYMDNKVKPIAYEYKAAVAAVKPEGVSYLELSEKVLRFVDVMQDTAHRFMTDTERTKLNGIAAGANNYVHPTNHPASVITEDATHRFVTDTEKAGWNGKAAGDHNHAGVYQPVGSYAPASHKHGATDVTEDATHRFVTDTEKAGWNGKAAGNHNHAGVYQPVGNYAPISHTHPATQVNEDTTHRFVTDAEKNGWDSKAAGNHNHDGKYQPAGSYAPASHKHAATDVTEDTTHRFVTDSDKTNWNGKAAGNHNHDDKYQPAGSYAPASHKHGASEINEDATHRFMTDAERSKLSGIAAGANNYAHPASHPASMIEESTSRKFMTDTEKNLLSTLGTNAALKDFSNVSTKSLSKNGYYKLPDGLMIQWGISDSGTQRNVYFPNSFYDTNYSLVTNEYTNGGQLAQVFSIHIMYVYKSYFTVKGRFSAESGISGDTTCAFFWLAIGRWK